MARSAMRSPSGNHIKVTLHKTELATHAHNRKMQTSPSIPTQVVSKTRYTTQQTAVFQLVVHLHLSTVYIDCRIGFFSATLM
jgi:hypothetical protein